MEADFRPWHHAAREGHVAAAEHLTARRAEVSLADGRGAWPLHVAAAEGHVAVAYKLVAVTEILGETTGAPAPVPPVATPGPATGTRAWRA